MSTVTDIEAIIEGSTGERPPERECHTFRADDWSLCGRVQSPNLDGDWHTTRECKERGHRSCVTCDELSRQLGYDFRVA
jgi:hypothetical protein